MKSEKTTELYWLDPEELTIVSDGDLVDYRAGLPVLESLVVDIMLRGIVEPVVVGKNEDGDLWVVDGQQRVKAAIEANRRIDAKPAGTTVRVRVPCVIRRGDRVSHYAAKISANEHRQADDPLTRARKVERFFALGGREEEAAISFGVHVRTIRNWLELLTAGPAVRKALTDGRLSATAALPIVKRPLVEQQTIVDGLKAARPDGERATVRQAKAAAAGIPETWRKRTRGRAELELVRMHRPAELRALTGETVIRWVLGELELPELEVGK
jgi:ParB family chromosome partitioning protein